MAMAATMAVPVFKGMPKIPMIPKFRTIGKRFGTSDRAPALTLTKSMDMITKIRINTSDSDFACPSAMLSAAALMRMFSPVNPQKKWG
jgi:hypothetical protein